MEISLVPSAVRFAVTGVASSEVPDVYPARHHWFVLEMIEACPSPSLALAEWRGWE